MEKQKHPRSQRASGSHGFAWAQWEYEPDEWGVFDQVDWVSVRNKSRLILILSPIIFLVITMVLWVLLAPSAKMAAFFLAFILLTPLILVMFAAVGTLRKAKKRYQARHNPAEPQRRVTFTSYAIWLSGTSFPFIAGSWHLESVHATANPTMLHFTLRLSPLPGEGGGYSDWPKTQRFHIPVPRSHEAEAEQLRQRYYAEVIKEKKKPANLPEPSL